MLVCSLIRPLAAARVAVVLAFGLGAGTAGCRGPQTSAAPEPTPLHARGVAEPSGLCASVSKLRSWGVLDEAGAIVATSRGRCLGPVEHPADGRLWHLVAQLQPVDAERSSWELHTWIDDAGQPRHAEFRTPEVVTRMTWTPSGLLVRRLGDELALGPESAALWPTPSHGLFVREVMLRLGVGLGADGVARHLGWIPEGDRAVTLELRVRAGGSGGLAEDGAGTVLALEADRPELAEPALAQLGLSSVMAGERLLYRPLDPSQDALAPFLPRVPKPRYRPPAELERVPVEVAPERSGEPVLVGELVVPRDVEGPLPGVVFLSGAGPQDRHGIVPDSPVDMGSHAIHDALARAGFAVLRVDDRGVGESGIGDNPTPGFDELVDDGRRALATLAAHPRVDPSRVLIVGHGEGALRASIVAGERGRKRSKAKLRGLIVLAAPGRNLRELIYDEIRASMVGRRDAEVRAVLQRARSVHDAALSGGDLPASSVGARQWMIEAFAEDPLARLGAVRAPILAIQGGKDFQVSAERDFGPVRALVEARGAPGSAALLFPELDYLLAHEPGVSTPGHYADLRRGVDEALLEALVEWARARVDA